MSVEDAKKVFIHNVRQRREAMGISVPELARRGGLSPAMLEELDRGAVPESMMVDDAWKLAEVFGCEPEELFR